MSRPDGTGAIVGDGAVAFKGVSIERCFDDGGIGESFTDGKLFLMLVWAIRLTMPCFVYRWRFVLGG